MDGLQYSGENDESFYDDLRAALVEAGDTDGEIDATAVYLVPWVIECTADRPESRRDQLELIGRHLACTDMTVRIGKGDSYVQVEFPNRPKIQ